MEKFISYEKLSKNSTAYMVPDICPWFENRYISLDDESKDFKLFEDTLKQHFYDDANNL